MAKLKEGRGALQKTGSVMFAAMADEVNKIAQVSPGAIIYPAILGGAGYMGYGKGKRMAREGEKAPEWGLGKYLLSGLVHPYGAYQVGKSIGYERKAEELAEGKGKGKK